MFTNKFSECRLGHLLIYTRFACLLFSIDFPEVHLKRFKSNPDTLRKCCLFDVRGNCFENTRIMSKSDQQTATKKRKLYLILKYFLSVNSSRMLRTMNRRATKKKYYLEKVHSSVGLHSVVKRRCQAFDIICPSKEQS